MRSCIGLLCLALVALGLPAQVSAQTALQAQKQEIEVGARVGGYSIICDTEEQSRNILVALMEDHATGLAVFIGYSIMRNEHGESICAAQAIDGMIAARTIATFQDVEMVPGTRQTVFLSELLDDSGRSFYVPIRYRIKKSGKDA